MHYKAARQRQRVGHESTLTQVRRRETLTDAYVQDMFRRRSAQVLTEKPAYKSIYFLGAL